MEEHGHHHHHHHHTEQLSGLNAVYVISIAANLLYVIVEALVGFRSGSLGLLSDAGHNLGDVFSLALAMTAFKLSFSHGNKRFTYGYRKASVLISLLNAVLLLAVVGAIILESIHKFRSADTAVPDGAVISWTAAVGIIVNGITAFLLMKQQKHDINTRGAFLHMVSDALVSVGVVISGIVIGLTGWSAIDPLISLVIAAVILFSTVRLLAESFRMSIDAVPEGMDIDGICSMMRSVEGVTDVHHVHIWSISTTQAAMTAHVAIDDISRMDAIRSTLKHKLFECGISHATLEIESSLSPCGEHDCNC